jgi:hypothetical protein
MADAPHSSFWGQIVRAGESAKLVCADDVYTVMTGACLGQVPPDESAPAMLRAKVTTVLLDRVEPDVNSEPKEVTEAILAVLEPGGREQLEVQHVFSPLNSVEVSVAGRLDIHISGTYVPLESDSDEEWDEEEEEEEEQTRK